jgi:AraC family transcriptional regulator
VNRNLKNLNLKEEFWICSAQTPGLWAWDSTDESLMFVIEPHLFNQIAEEVSGVDASGVELLNVIGAGDPKIQAIADLFQAELDGGGLGESLYTESLGQVLIIHLLRHYTTIQPVVDYIHSHLDRPLHLAELAFKSLLVKSASPFFGSLKG